MLPAATSPALIATRSRGPPRPSERRETARCRSGQPLSAARSAARRAGSVEERLHRIQPAPDRRGAGQGRREARRQQPAAGAGHGAVDRRQEAALALAGEAAQQLEIAPGRGVDQQVAAGRQPARQAPAAAGAPSGSARHSR